MATLAESPDAVMWPKDARYHQPNSAGTRVRFMGLCGRMRPLSMNDGLGNIEQVGVPEGARCPVR